MWGIFACFVCATWCLNEAIKPIIMFHGLLDDHFSMDILHQFIDRDFPGTNYIHSLHLFPHEASLVDLHLQAEIVKQRITDLRLDGEITYIGYSMGGLTGRVMIESWDDHNITTFISLAGPQMGVCMIPPDSQKYFEGFNNETISMLAYSEVGQSISVMNMWNDPQRQEKYLRGNTYLPPSLCEVPQAQEKELNNTYQQECAAKRRNLSKLKKWVLVGGPQDGTVEPWQSSLLGFYDDKWAIVPREKQSFYSKLGIDVMEKQGVLLQCVQEGVEHHHWPRNNTVYENCIRPHIS